MFLLSKRVFSGSMLVLGGVPDTDPATEKHGLKNSMQNDYMLESCNLSKYVFANGFTCSKPSKLSLFINFNPRPWLPSSYVLLLVDALCKDHLFGQPFPLLDTSQLTGIARGHHFEKQ